MVYRENLAKRILDAGLSSLWLLCSAPVWLVVPLAIKLESGGPVFFGQERVGKDGRLFTSWKFRSMKVGPAGTLRAAELETDRITRVGRLLRACALDELPQLWNILRGDMSFVGPRALLPVEEVHGSTVRMRDVPGYDERHSIRPGLTGLAQVSAPRDISHRHKFRYDLLYVRRRSFLLDLKLISLSVLISLGGRWPQIGNGRSVPVRLPRSARGERREDAEMVA